MKNKKILIIILIIMGVIMCGGFLINGVFDLFFKKVVVTETISKEEVIVDTSLIDKEEESKVLNIALFGVDNRKGDYGLENSRSDAMKILSLDTKNNRAVITSLQRDMLIYIPEPINDFDKLNHPYWYGGVELALKTFNYNFDLDITRYVTVNFSGVEGIVDLMGGIEVEVLPNEISGTNQWIADLDNIEGENRVTPKLKSSGIQILNGRQALAYMRNRNVGSDYARMDRQTKVLKAMANQAKSLTLIEIMELINKGMTYVETNIQKSEIIQLVKEALQVDLSLIEQFQVPSRGYEDTKSVSYKGYGPLYVNRSYQEMVKEIHYNIYQDENYEPTSNVIDNEASIYSLFGQVN